MVQEDADIWVLAVCLPDGRRSCFLLFQDKRVHFTARSMMLENWSEHNKVNRSTVTLSSSTALYWGWTHLQLFPMQNDSADLEVQPRENHSFFSPYVQFRKHFHLQSLTGMLSDILLYPLSAGCIHNAKLSRINHPIPWKYTEKTYCTNNPIINQPVK